MFELISKDIQNYIVFVLASIIQFYVGFEFYKTSYQALKNKIADMNLLIAIGTSAAYIYSVLVLFFPDLFPEQAKHLYFESSAAIITFILLGRYIETKSKNKAMEFMKHLLQLKPEYSIIEVDGRQTKVPTSNIIKGDIVIVKTGDKVPVDGIVIEGKCEVNQSVITGESLPVLKQQNDEVISGSIITDGFCKIKATKTGKQTTIDQIIQLLLKSQNQKPQIAKLADKIVYYFVPTILILSVIVFDLWYFFTQDIQMSLIPAVSVLIIACPCALGLATPIAIVSTIGRSAKEGILIKNSDVIETIKQIKTIVFDKTGTLTKGNLKVKQIHTESEDTKNLLYNLVKLSNHPISKSIEKHLDKSRLQTLHILNFENYTGKGIKAEYQGKKILLGNLKFLKENNVNIEAKFINFYEKNSQEGNIVVFFAVENQIKCAISLQDEIKEDAYQLIQYLKNKGYDVYMLTGDNDKVAKYVAKILNIDMYFANLLPEDKQKIVQDLQSKGKKVMFIGDGINDAVAISVSDLGVATSDATNITKEVGDVVILNNNLKTIKTLIELLNFGNKIMKQNLTWAYIYNIIGIPIAGGILYPINGILLKPAFAGIAMAFSSVSVVSNALRIHIKRFF